MEYLNGGASGGTEQQRPHFHVLNMVLSSGMVEERCTCEGCSMFCTCPPSCSSMICCDNCSKRGEEKRGERRGGGRGGKGKEGKGGDARERSGRWEGERGKGRGRQKGEREREEEREGDGREGEKKQQRRWG